MTSVKVKSYLTPNPAQNTLPERRRVHVHLSVTRSGSANDNQSWKTLFFSKQVIFSYLNHTTKAYLRFTSKVEDFIRRLVQYSGQRLPHDPVLRVPGHQGAFNTLAQSL